jgi:hypothetical protein
MRRWHLVTSASNTVDVKCSDTQTGSMGSHTKSEANHLQLPLIPRSCGARHAAPNPWREAVRRPNLSSTAAFVRAPLSRRSRRDHLDVFVLANDKLAWRKVAREGLTPAFFGALIVGISLSGLTSFTMSRIADPSSPRPVQEQTSLPVRIVGPNLVSGPVPHTVPPNGTPTLDRYMQKYFVVSAELDQRADLTSAQPSPQAPAATHCQHCMGPLAMGPELPQESFKPSDDESTLPQNSNAVQEPIPLPTSAGGEGPYVAPPSAVAVDQGTAPPAGSPLGVPQDGTAVQLLPGTGTGAQPSPVN